MLVEKPTGITNYVNHILPYLTGLQLVQLVAKEYANYNYQEYYNISPKFSPDYGSKGHFLRLSWTQFQLPRIYHQLAANLLFSPVPEAPLYSKCRSVIMVHDLIPIRFPKKKSPLTPYFRYYIPLVCQQAEHIICNSQATADDIINYFQIPASKITPIPLGYDRDKFKKLQDLKNDQITPYYLYLGRHDPHKNVPKIVKAFAQFEYNQDYHLYLAGPPDKRYTPKIKQQADELGIARQVKFLDYVSAEKLPIIINQATALVFPTLWEGFGFPVLEAMACGTPVITSTVSSLPEVAGDAALLVNPHNETEISQAMLQLADSAQLRSHLSELGLKRATQFSWEKTGKATREIISAYA